MKTTRELVIAAMFTALMCVVTILMRIIQPVAVLPFSLQPLIMMLAAYLLPPRTVLYSMSAYLVLGLIGMPVFSLPPWGGLGYFLVPSFGFLLAFPLSGWLQAKLIKGQSLLRMFMAALAGIGVYYLIGLPYMYIILNFYVGKSIDVVRLLMIGFLPFIVFDIVKIIVAIYLGRAIRERLAWQNPEEIH